MMTTAMPPAQMVVNIEDLSVVNDVRRALRLMRGVGKVSLKKRKPAEKTLDITQTACYREAKEDIRMGRVYRADSVEDMMRQILED